ncbi:MAG TPA: MerR family transcriptional regulator [Noviherbaspirillum sp.]
MLLKVGELAKRTGLTVRTLHHYDAIGLLTPSARSDAGYRLYNQTDIARLHSIQALRHLGLPLSDIGSMLTEEGAPLPMIISRQIHALDREIARATELRGRLSLLQERLSAGSQPDMSDWLTTLQQMATYGKYFTADELKKIFENWKQTEAEWLPLIEDVRHAMESGIMPDAPEAQPLARRWMALSMRWMEGDFDLLMRWVEMRRKEPGVHGLSGPGTPVIEYIGKAIELRMAVLHKYLGKEEIKSLIPVPEREWEQLGEEVGRLMRQDLPVECEEAQALARKWSELFDRVCGNNPVIREKLLNAARSDPFMQAGSPLDAPVRDYIRRVYAAGMANQSAIPSR